uniref:Uncharacterized protein n=1 Tax=Zea mays TaxID=4577 RepID=A0A804R4Z7_MAIZE
MAAAESTSEIYEALELRNGGSDYYGKGVLKVVNNVNNIIGPAIVGKICISIIRKLVNVAKCGLLSSWGPDLQEVGYQGSRINFLAIGLVSFISWVENDCLMDGDDGWIQMMCFFVNFLNKLKSRNIPYNFLWSGASKPAPSTPSSQTINCVQSSVCGITGWSWMQRTGIHLLSMMAHMNQILQLRLFELNSKVLLHFFYSRLVPLVLLLVEGSTPIDIGEHGCEMLLVVKKATQESGSKFELLGFAAVHNFYHYPESIRLRISQDDQAAEIQAQGLSKDFVQWVNQGEAFWY